MRRSTLFWGCIIVLIGILLLVNNFTDVDIGTLIWPLVLIALGLWVLWGVLTGPRAFETEEATIPLEGAGHARVRVRHGAGRLRVDAGAGPGELMTGTFSGGLGRQVERVGDTLNVEVRVRVGGPYFVFPWMWGPGRTLDWSFSLNGDIPLALDFETGASDARLDLTNLRVTELRLKTGASSTEIRMPANAGYTKADISSGAASLRIRVPSGVAARVRVEGGLAGITVDRSRFPRTGDVYQSEDYHTASNRIDIAIETGVGSVDIR